MMYSYAESLIQTGFDDGFEKGFENGIVMQISKLIAHGWSFDEAFDLLAEPGMDRKNVRSLIDAGTAS